MSILAAKLLHKAINSLPGMRYRLWLEYQCPTANLQGHWDPEREPFRVSSQDLVCLKNLKPDAGSLDSLAERLTLGNECWAVRIGEAWVYSQWVMANRSDKPLSLERPSHAPRGMMLEPHSIYFWDAWCAPNWRNCGINRTTKAWIMSSYFTEGFHNAVTLILPFNLPNRRSVATLGFQYCRPRLELRLKTRSIEIQQ